MRPWQPPLRGPRVGLALLLAACHSKAPWPEIAPLPRCSGVERAELLGTLAILPRRGEGIPSGAAEAVVDAAVRVLDDVGVHLDLGPWVDTGASTVLGAAPDPVGALAASLPLHGATVVLIAPRVAPPDHGLGLDLLGFSVPRDGLRTSGLGDPSSLPDHHAAVAAVAAPGPGGLSTAEAGAVLAHELLHTLGLHHREEAGALMASGRPTCRGGLSPLEREALHAALGRRP